MSPSKDSQASVKRRAKPVKVQRLRRLNRISDAERDLESALLTLKNHFNIWWTKPCFTNLYYLVRLARIAK